MTKDDNIRQLNDKQKQAIPLILSGKNDSEVAKGVGSTRQTINKWKNQDHHFQAELNYQRQANYDSQIDRLRKLRVKAVNIIENELDSDDIKTRQKAARFILKLNLKPTGKITWEEIENDKLIISSDF